MIFSKSITKLKIISLILIFSFSLVPPLIKELFDFSSYTQGLIIAILISIVINRINVNINNNSLFVKIIMNLVVINLFYLIVLLTKKFIYGQGIDYFKFFLFFPLVFGLLFCSKNLAKIFIISKNEHLRDVINIFLFILIIGGLAAIFGYSAYGPLNMRKPTFVYSEVSHYALGIGPFLCYGLFANKGYLLKFFLITSILLIGFFVQSTALLVTFFFAIYPLINSIWMKYFFILISIIFVVYFGGDYFINRLSVLPSSSNETNWVYLQGIEEAFLSLRNTYGIGLGPQQMGFEDPSGEYSQLVYSIQGDYINRYDGSIGFSKIISEFGVLGILICLIYLMLFLKSYIYLANLNQNKIQTSQYVILSHSFIYMFFVYMFVRGGGYFGPNYFYLFVGIFCIYYYRVLPSSEFKACIYKHNV